jgi:hypothetical protein
MRLIWAVVPLASLALGACALGETPLPGTTKILDEMPRVDNSTKAPCWMQKAVAAQNSYVDSIKQKREIVYAAPCVVDKPKAVTS